MTMGLYPIQKTTVVSKNMKNLVINDPCQIGRQALTILISCGDFSNTKSVSATKETLIRNKLQSSYLN